MPILTETLLTTTWLLSLSSLVQPLKSHQAAFATPQRITASLSNSNDGHDNTRSFYVPPYGTIRPSIVILSARPRDYAVHDDEYNDMEEDFMGGNYWVNPSRSLDRFPSPAVEAVRRRRGGGGRRDEKRSYNGFRQGGGVTVSGGRAGAPRKDNSGDWWETTRMDDDYDDDDENYDDDYEEDEYEEYGMPPPTRSRSSFRTGAPPPPRPIKDFYNKLFWFGFDPSATRPTDRTMFGGTRGKFNAMELLRDRELRQQQQQRRRTDISRSEGGSRRSLRGKRAYNPAVQDFGDVREWNARKMGTSPAGGKGVGDDAVVEQFEVESEYNRAMRNLPPGEERIPPIMDVDYDPVLSDEEPFYNRDEVYWDEDLPPPPPPPPPPVGRRRRPSRDRYYDDEEDDDFNFELDDRVRPTTVGRRRNSMERRRKLRDDRGERRKGWDLFPLPESKRRQAEAYDRFIGLGPRPGEEDYGDMDDEYESIVPRSSRRRAGFAYKFDDYDEDGDGDYNDDDVIDIRPTSKYSTSSPRRSWEERAMEMDRIPPRSVGAWGPNGRVDKDAQTLAVVDAEREIQKTQKYLEKKEDLVEDAKQEVASLKSDASFYEKQLELQQDGRESKIAKRELGYILRDIEDASRILRMAKAERDAAIKMLDRLKSKHWALLSEYEAVRSFEVD